MPINFNQFQTGITNTATDQLLGVDSTGGDIRVSPSAFVPDILEQIKNHPATPAAWICFEGTTAAVGGQATIYSSFNISKVTRLSDFVGAGGTSNGRRYLLEFAKPLKDGNYAVVATGHAGFNDPLGDDQYVGVYSKETNLPSSCIVTTIDMDVRNNNSTVTEGSLLVNIAIFGNKV